MIFWFILDNITSTFRDKKVLITGHTGFKGSWLTLYLLRMGAEVWGYSLEPDKDYSLFRSLKLYERIDNPFFNNFRHHIGDINNLKSISNIVLNCNPDIVFHLAAQSLVLESYKNPINTWNTNVMGTLKFLETDKTFKKEKN